MKKYNFYIILKFPKMLFWFVLTFIIVSCSSIKKVSNNCKKNPFEELDSLERVNQVLNYKINIPKNWEKSKTSGGDYLFLRDKSIDSFKFNSIKASVSIDLNKIKYICKSENTTKENFLDYIIKYRSKWFESDDFKYSILKSNHKLYGDIYILKYIEKIRPNYSLMREFILIFHENKGYTLQYCAEPKYFEVYQPEFEKMIDSFRIL